jgi:hypothetical protein
MMEALKKFLRTLLEDERQRVYMDRYNEAGNVAADFSVSLKDVKDACREIGLESEDNRRWPFLWLTAINRAHGEGRISVKGLKVGVALFGFCSPSNHYTWPGQQVIAERAGWSLQNRRGVYEGLRELEGLNALRRMRFIDMPVEVIEAANRAGRKPKDPRSAAYFLRSIEEWRLVDVYPLKKHRSVSPGEALNSHIKRSPALPDVSSCSGDSIPTSEYASPLYIGADQGKHAC